MGEKRKKALIAVNTIGFMWFIWDDIDILRELGYEVVVAGDNSRNEDYSIAEIERRGARFVDIRGSVGRVLTRDNLNAFRNFRRLIGRERFDAIICHTSITGLLVRIAARISGGAQRPKVIYMSHGLPWTHLSGYKKKLLFRSAESVGSRFCDAIITINDEDRKSLASMHCNKVYKVDSVGCDVARFRDVHVDTSAKRREIGVEDNRIIVMAVGAVTERKNHVVIAQAIAMLPDPARFCYVVCGHEPGDGSRGREMLRIGRQAGFEVKMLGARADIPELMHIADIGVLPSLSEGFGMAGVEQLSAGVPVVGTNVQGISTYVVDGETGFLVNDPHDAAAFAAALEKLSDNDARMAMTSKCVATAERFGIERAVAQRKNIYREILG